MIVLGFDPGLSGAMAILSDDTPAVFDIPTVALESGAVQRRVHGPGLARIIRDNVPKGVPVLAVVEELSAGGQNRGNAMTVGSQFRTRGTIECVLEILGLKVETVTPQRWKKLYGFGKDKNDALRLARELYPALAPIELRLAKHHNRAEALLIARWGMKVLA